MADNEDDLDKTEQVPSRPLRRERGLRELMAAKPKSLDERVALAQERLETFNRLAASPRLDQEAQGVARNLARMAAASLALGQKALDYRDSGQQAKDQAENERTLAIYRLLRMQPPTLPGREGGT